MTQTDQDKLAAAMNELQRLQAGEVAALQSLLQAKARWEDADRERNRASCDVSNAENALARATAAVASARAQLLGNDE